MPLDSISTTQENATTTERLTLIDIESHNGKPVIRLRDEAGHRVTLTLAQLAACTAAIDLEARS